MATQVKFYSTTAAAYESASKDSGGVYFVDGGELYKGAERFGANKIFQVSNASNLENISGQISGDLAVGFGWTKAWNGSAWVQIENDAQIKTMVSLMTSGLAVGGASSYITYITQDENGNVSAAASDFKTDVKTAIGNNTSTDTSNGVTVSVTTTSGVVTAVDVSAPEYTAAQSTKSSTANGITASVTSSKGQVTAVSLTAANLTPTSVSAESGTFTNLTVTSTANFSVTNVSATNLTVGGKTVSAIADEQIAAIGSVTKTGTSNGITVSVTTSGGSVNAVSVDATAFGNVMKFRGVVASTADVTSPKAGDIVIIGSSPTGGAVTGQEYIYDGSKWELIGDQNTYATKAYVDTQVSSVAQLAASGYSLALSANASATAAYVSAITNVVTAGGSITTSNGNLVTASAVAEYAM